VDRIQRQPQQPTPEPWPEATIARYLTVGGALVDLSHDTYYLADTEPNTTIARCGGCDAHHQEQWSGYAYRSNNGSSGADTEAGKWAQAHASECRALPRPAVQA
jgi:hypothetical protein